MPTKFCSKCGSTYETTEFPRDRRRNDGRYPYCKGCAVALSTMWKLANPEKFRASQRRRAERNKARNTP